MNIPIGTPPGVHTGPYDATARPSTAKPDRALPGASFARVYELEEARRRREVNVEPMPGDRIPDEVWDEVDAAARLFDRLQAEGSRVVFDTDRLSGKVVASLLGSDGGQQVLPLTDAVDPTATRPSPPPPFGLDAGAPTRPPVGGLRAVYGEGSPADRGGQE